MFSSVPVTDPVQLRWTVVRLTDLLQALEKENADIRMANKVRTQTVLFDIAPNFFAPYFIDTSVLIFQSFVHRIFIFVIK